MSMSTKEIKERRRQIRDEILDLLNSKVVFAKNPEALKKYNELDAEDARLCALSAAAGFAEKTAERFNDSSTAQEETLSNLKKEAIAQADALTSEASMATYSELIDTLRALHSVVTQAQQATQSTTLLPQGGETVESTHAIESNPLFVAAEMQMLRLKVTTQHLLSQAQKMLDSVEYKAAVAAPLAKDDSINTSNAVVNIEVRGYTSTDINGLTMKVMHDGPLKPGDEVKVIDSKIRTALAASLKDGEEFNARVGEQMVRVTLDAQGAFRVVR